MAAADFDEYEYLEKQLEKKDENGRANGERHKERHKDRDRDRDREKRSDRGEKDRERDRDKPKDSKRSSSKREHRSRSRSRERRHKSSDHKHKKHRTRSRSRERRPRTPPRARTPPRERTPPEVREARERERELKELDRDIRTVFAYNLPLRADERDLFKFFSGAGLVEDVRIITDRNTRKSKGFAYIEYANREDVVAALALTGQTLMGQAVMVKSSEAEKNMAWEAAQQQNATLMQMNAQALGAGTGPCKLYVGNLHPNISESDLKQIFEPFGPVDYISLQHDAAGRSQGFGFVQYQVMADATKAMHQLDGMDIAGNKIQVKIAALSPLDASLPAAAGAGGALPGAAQALDLDDTVEDEHGGLKLTANARAALMSRLAGVPGVSTLPPALTGMAPGLGMPGALPGPPNMVPAGTVVLQANAQALALEQGVLGPASPIPTQCLLLKNMFDPAEETDPEWEKDIESETKDECSKYGAVLHVHADKNSKGYVYLKFASVEGSAAAQKQLHGRWFAGRQVVAEFQFTAVYNGHFRV